MHREHQHSETSTETGLLAKHIRAWQSSSQSQKASCQSNRIALATFCYWKCKLSGRNLKETTF
ncbi:IS66 family insertion sequence element accessory protein TnpA [Desulfosediminicola ganghwensis]|uniref:IS66 family insertion sequence element accessory protein TnpA n=1 Tax=Desulfosediminicola ganghwensis TaxID=2569540 RepID=UPI003B8311A7